MKRRFLLTPAARDDLREILLDIAENSPDTAERLRREFYEGLQGLGKSPGIGHSRDEDCGTDFAGAGDRVRNRRMLCGLAALPVCFHGLRFRWSLHRVATRFRRAIGALCRLASPSASRRARLASMAPVSWLGWLLWIGGDVSVHSPRARRSLGG